MQSDEKGVRNRGGGYVLEVPCKYVFEGNSLAVKWLSERIAKEMVIVEEVVTGNKDIKPYIINCIIAFLSNRKQRVVVHVDGTKTWGSLRYNFRPYSLLENGERHTSFKS